MDLFAHMATLVRVVEAGSLSAASRQLRVSVGAVSRQIAALEAAVGATLLARTTRRMTVTAAGQQYYERCRRILRDVDEAQAVGRDDALVGSVRVSVPVTLGFRAGAALFAPLLAAQPTLRLDVRIEDRLVDLVLEDVDVAVRVGPLPLLSTDVVARPLSRWPRVVVASPAYVRRHGLPRTPAALAAHEAISPRRDAVTETWTLVNGAQRAEVRVKVRCACNAGNVQRDLAVAGLGLARLPPWFVAEDLHARRLRRLLPDWETETVVVHALYRAAHANRRRVRVVVDHLQAVYADFER